MRNRVRYYILVFLLGVLSFPSLTQKVDISVKVEGLGAGKVQLRGVFGSQIYIADSAIADNSGVFSFKRDSAFVNGIYYCVLPDKKGYFEFILDRDQTFTLTTRLTDLKGSMKVEGSKDNSLLYENARYDITYEEKFQSLQSKMAALPENDPERQEIRKKLNALNKERLNYIRELAKDHPKSFYSKFKLAGQNPELKYPKDDEGNVDKILQAYLYRNEFWKDVDLSDPGLLRTPVIHAKLDRFFNELLDQKVDSIIKYSDMLIQRSMANKEVFKYVVNFIGLKYKKPAFIGSDAVYIHVVNNYITEKHAFWASPYEIRRIHTDAAIRQACLPGSKGKDIELQDQFGNSYNLLDISDEYTVLFIYSATCEHCQKAAPTLVKAYPDLKEYGVRVMALCTDQDTGQWQAFLKKYSMEPFINVIDIGFKSKYEYSYHVDITPEIYVLDPDKVIIAKDIGPEQILRIIERDANEE